MKKWLIVGALLAGCAEVHTGPMACVEPTPEREISQEEACSALGNAWASHSGECGPFVCPYTAPVDIDDSTMCILGLLDLGDAGAACGELSVWVEGCVCE